MDPEIRNPTTDELPGFVTAMDRAFLTPRDANKVAEDLRPLWDLSRVWAAFVDGRPVSTFRTFATELTVPGLARLPATGVSAVTVQPDHRRRGLLRRMVAAEHAAARDRGEAFALLYAAEYAIYGRFGYGPAVLEATWTLDAAGAVFHAEPGGSVEIMPRDTSTRDACEAVYEAHRARTVGEIKRVAYRWDFEFGLRIAAARDEKRWKGFLAVHRNAAGEIDGYATYAADDPEHWERRQPRVKLEVHELHGLDVVATTDLWRYLVSVDWVSTVEASHRSPSDPLPWLLENGRAADLAESGDGMWLRLLDVRRALEARTYERTGSLVLEVIDGEAVGGKVRLALDAGPDGATCQPTDRSADLTLDVSALGAAYLGGSRLSDAVRARGVDEHRAGALAQANALFKTVEEPWCSTFF
jgi:predicted acetyltransferase